MRSSNPVFRTLERSEAYVGTEAASYRGIVGKTGLLLITAILSGYLFLYSINNGLIPVSSVYPLLIGSVVVALISVIVSTRSIRFAAPAAITYALAEGVLLGLITVIADAYAPGAALAAVVATASIFTVMLFLYSSRTIRVTERFRRIMYSVLMGFLFFIVIGFIINLVSPGLLVLNSPLLLIISGVFIIYGALMLTLDFDRAEMIVESGADRSYEWMVAVGLMVTIVWIYIELLRFLMIIANSRR